MKCLIIYIISLFFLFSCKTIYNKASSNFQTANCTINNIDLSPFVNFLNNVIPEYKEKWGEGFRIDIDNCFAKRFTIYDLSNDIVCNLYEKGFELKEGHVYYFYCLDDDFSFDHIAYIGINGKFIFFEAINCKDRGDNLQDVINFLELKLNNHPKKLELLQRVNNYREYFYSGSIDGIKVPLRCDCDPCN